MRLSCCFLPKRAGGRCRARGLLGPLARRLRRWALKRAEEPSGLAVYLQEAGMLF
jgi:hypothetical protein